MIKLYTTQTCYYCTRAKNYLDTLKIPYETLDINKDKDSFDFFIKSGHRSVPQIYVGSYLLCEGGSDGLVKMTKDQIHNKVLELTSKKIIST